MLVRVWHLRKNRLDCNGFLVALWFYHSWVMGADRSCGWCPKMDSSPLTGHVSHRGVLVAWCWEPVAHMSQTLVVQDIRVCAESHINAELPSPRATQWARVATSLIPFTSKQHGDQMKCHQACLFKDWFMFFLSKIHKHIASSHLLVVSLPQERWLHPSEQHFRCKCFLPLMWLLSKPARVCPESLAD